VVGKRLAAFDWHRIDVDVTCKANSKDPAIAIDILSFAPQSFTCSLLNQFSPGGNAASPQEFI